MNRLHRGHDLPIEKGPGLSGDLAELLFGPKAPIGKDERIKTIPGGGWFIYFQTFGRQAAPFDGSWKPGDFERVD